jgi:hypothetical protein
LIIINGKEYKINLDIKWGTEKLIKVVIDNPEHPNAEKYMTAIFKDILIPSPTAKELFNFRKSDVSGVFKEYIKEVNETNSDFKKKLSQ